MTDVPRRLFIAIVLVEQRERRKQSHLDLLRRRQTGGVIQGDLTAVRHHAVDKPQLRRMLRQRPVPLIQTLHCLVRQAPQQMIEHIVFVDRDDAEPPARYAKVF